MKKMLLFLLPLFACITSNAQHSEVVRKTAEAMLRLSAQKEYAGYVSYFYPTEIKERGGKEKFINQIIINEKYNAALPPLKIEERLGKVSKIYKAGKELHCTIEWIIKYHFTHKTALSMSHFLAISGDQGKTWKFIMTSGKTPGQVWSMVPKYNKELVYVDYYE